MVRGRAGGERVASVNFVGAESGGNGLRAGSLQCTCSVMLMLLAGCSECLKCQHSEQRVEEG